MEVIKPSSTGTDHQFNFNSACNSPYVTAPSSPQRFGNYIFTTAPATPTRATAFHQDSGDNTSSTIPFNWEEKPGTPKSISSQYDTDDQDTEDFAFDFSSQLDQQTLSAADDLFYGGKIKPLKPPPRLCNFEIRVRSDSPKSPTDRIKQALSPRKKVKEFDPFAAAMEETRRPDKIPPTTKWCRKWKLKNLLLFRSASEGHREKYEKLKKSDKNEDSKNWSFRSAEGCRKVSAHEWHYNVNRTVAEEMRRRTYLPYKQGLFGCLGFRVAGGVHEISNRGIALARE